MSSERCQKCAFLNQENARFCSSCGASLLTIADEVTLTDLPKVFIDENNHVLNEECEAILFVLQGPKAGSRYALDEDNVTIGRHPDSTIFFDDVTVSRQHSEVRKVGNQYIIFDVGSLNGTYVNRQRVVEQVLSPGDEVQIGKFKLVFQMSA